MKKAALIIFSIFWLTSITCVCFGQKSKPVKTDSCKIKIAVLKAQYETAAANLRTAESSLDKAKRQLTAKNNAIHAKNDTINKLTEDLDFYKMVYNNSKLFSDYLTEKIGNIYTITERHISNRKKIKAIRQLLIK